MKSIVILIPYFGPFPKQFQFWLNSAYNNPSVDFVLLTDNYLDCRDNVKVFKMSFEELVALVQSKFDFPIKLTNPYKLCDYRGAYGYIFSDYIQNYDFWGFGDIDLVYGDIRSFITEDILFKYKILLGWGHLTFYENSEFCNQFFAKRIEGFLDYRDAFTIEKYYHFDEFLHGGMSDRWKGTYPDLLWENTPFDDILVPRLSFNFISVFNPSVSNHLIFEYCNQNLFRVYLDKTGNVRREQILYAHFQQRKFMRVNTVNVDKYLIIPNSFINYSEFSISTLKRWTRRQLVLRQLWNLRNKVIKRVKKIKLYVANYYN